jgi:hypothetical protein
MSHAAILGANHGMAMAEFGGGKCQTKQNRDGADKSGASGLLQIGSRVYDLLKVNMKKIRI